MMDESGQIPYWSDENPPVKVRAGQRFIFRRSGWDTIWREHCPNVDEGQIVRVVQLPSAPKPGTMGQVHIEDAQTGEFLGMCSMKSLMTQTDELERSGQVKMVKHNPGDIHIDIGSHNENPPGELPSILELERAWTAAKDAGDEDEAYRISRLLLMHDHMKKAREAGTGEAFFGYIKSRSHKNPPLEILSKKVVDKPGGGATMYLHYRITAPMNSVKEVEQILKTLYPGWKAISHGSLKTGMYPNVKHAYGVTFVKNFNAKNPPLPASALIDLTTAKTIAREIGDDIIPVRPNIGRIDNLLDRALQKLRGSHLGATDWENPGPGRFKRYKSREKVAGTEIYKDIVEIKAIKRDGKRYVHKFGLGSHIIGLPDGSILIESRKGKRLWKNFKQGG